MKLVMTSYRLGEMSGGFGETGFLDIPPSLMSMSKLSMNLVEAKKDSLTNFTLRLPLISIKSITKQLCKLCEVTQTDLSDPDLALGGRYTSFFGAFFAAAAAESPKSANGAKGTSGRGGASPPLSLISASRQHRTAWEGRKEGSLSLITSAAAAGGRTLCRNSAALVHHVNIVSHSCRWFKECIALSSRINKCGA